MSSLAPAPSLREEPALAFWLSYAQRHGALVEEGSDSALVLLPEALQAQAELPEEVTVTASPELAREEAAALLIAGHPAVERAATAVLSEGDTGCAFLPWPRSRPPSRAELSTHARELVGVEHGRIDPAGEPIAAYLPLLRVGAMVSYTASLTLRFQEQEHVLLDARNGLEPPRKLSALAQGGRWLERADGHGRLLPGDVAATLATAHALIAARVAAREAALAAHARRSLASELARAEGYFERQLASLERRRDSAPVDRARLLEAQAQATRAEWARRRREIEEEYRPRHEIRPFRLQLIYAPVFVAPVLVRRGSVTFSLELTWIPAAGEFATLRCPACGALEPLVASRQRLGCRGCCC